VCDIAVAFVLDPLLRSFVETPDEVDAERELSALIEQHALPLAKAIVGRKLRSYKDDRPGRAAPGDQDDVVADAMVTLIERVRAAREGADRAPIENFVNYAAVVIHSACAHHLRRRYPERARLKNRLRYIFSTEHGLAIWTTADDDLACGLAEWRGRSIDTDAGRAARDFVERGGQRWAAMSRAELAAAASDLVASLGGPVDFEAFVRAVASAAGLVEPRETDDPALLAAREPPPDVTIDQRRFLVRVWDEVGELPVRQRIALLLNLRDATGAGLLWLLPITGVATVRQIARLLEIGDAEFAGLWGHLPLDDERIGQRLGCTRQQVINLRMAARKRLLNRAGAADPGPRGPGANLAPVSASLRSRA
jgi:RNA polymerase sigma factor (sigma-70 family)